MKYFNKTDTLPMLSRMACEIDLFRFIAPGPLEFYVYFTGVGGGHTADAPPPSIASVVHTFGAIRGSWARDL